MNKKLFDIQNEIKNPTKNTKGYGYMYASLDQVLDLIKPLLFKYRMLLTQRPCNEGSLIGVDTTITDLDSGEKYASKFFIEISKKDPQGYGSAITYLRRYSLVSMFNLTPEDDDGRAAMVTEDESKKVLIEIKKHLKVIDDKPFVEKVEKYISKSLDYKSLTNVLAKIQEQITKETE